MTSAHLSNLPLAGSTAAAFFRAEYRTIRRKSCFCVAALALVGAAACGGGGGDSSGGGDPVTGPPPAVNLTFTLQQVNGQNLPATFQPVGGKVVIGSGTMLLRADKSFTENIVYTFTPNGGTAAADTAVTAGTYLQTGTDVVFTVPPAGSEAAAVFNGTISGNTLTYNDAGFVAVYQR